MKKNFPYNLKEIVFRRICQWTTLALRALPPEPAHKLAIHLLSTNIHKYFYKSRPQLDNLSFQIEIPGLPLLPHPICLAAGFDKNASALEGLSNLNFAMLETGTLTPKAQPGNKTPRLFRQVEQSALINRMGFNNIGCDRAIPKLESYQKKFSTVPLGINIGKNKDTPLSFATEDYLSSMQRLEGLGDYFVINISSPNTPGLRKLSSPEFVKELGQILRASRDEKLSDVFVKLDPDSSKKHIQLMIEAICEIGFGGVILTNTHRVTAPYEGGQSGHPLAVKSTLCLEWAHEVHQGTLPMIGSGGVLSGSDVYQKLIRGASAVQIYSALVFRGPFVVESLLEELAQELRLRKITFLKDIIGRYYEDPSLS